MAYVLKEAFGQLWDYQTEGWARRFFDNWRDSLKWQRLKPYEQFAEMIESHCNGIAAYCKPENKISLGFVEGLNNVNAGLAQPFRLLGDACGAGVPYPVGSGCGFGPLCGGSGKHCTVVGRH